MQMESTAAEKPIRSMTDERLDFDYAAPLRKSYIVASSYRCGSTYFCWLLWKTGVLGAPSESLNSATNELRVMMTRLKAYSPADYIAKLLACRTSRNGIFGMKVHFPHFETFLAEYPELLDVLSPLTYIYIDRLDKVAQAVSMAKALQTNQWSSRWEKGPAPALQYDRDLIAKCMAEVQLQDAGWLQWLEANKIAPHTVIYEDLAADPEATVRGIVDLFGVANDEPSQVHVPPAKKQGDDTNQEWIARYREETKITPAGGGADAGGALDGAPAAAVAHSAPPGAGEHFFDRYDWLIRNLPNVRASPTGFIGVIRLRRRYDAIIARNRALLQNARVLDIQSFSGFWSLAALDAGAAHIVALETTRDAVDAAKANVTEYGIKSDTCQFINSKVFAALNSFKPGQFDVVLCKGYFEHCHAPEFLRHMVRLQPKHVILDTRIGPGSGPLTRFSLAGKAWKEGQGRITSTPNHDLIAFLSEPDFSLRVVDWKAMGVTDWTGVPDYARDVHRTYVLDRAQ